MSNKKISTTDVQVGGLPKTIQPGEHVLKINKVSLSQFEFMKADDGYFLVLEVETKPIPEFEGFFIDKADESKGRYAGQVGLIKTNRFYYRDGKTKSGITVNRDMEILKQLKNLCIASGELKWFTDADGKYDTIEDFIAAFNSAAPFKDKYFKMCVAGKEFPGENGFMRYDLFLAKTDRGKVAYEPEGVKNSRLMQYDESIHITRAEAKEVQEFGVNDTMPGETQVPGDLTGPEFSL